ncbi:hypothetical protein T484DRAFT_1855606, partial [Baffinella frigidus]
TRPVAYQLLLSTPTPSFPGACGALTPTPTPTPLPPGATTASLSTLLEAPLVKGCAYAVGVQAGNEAGWGESAETQVVVALGLSSQPRNLLATAARARQLTVFWDVPEDTGDGTSRNAAVVQRFVVEASDTTGFGTVISTVSADSGGRSATLDGLTPNVAVFVRVFAVTSAGDGETATVQGTSVIPPLLEISVSLSSYITGDIVDVTLSLRLSTPLTSGNSLELTLPEGFDGSAATFVSAIVSGAPQNLQVSASSDPRVILLVSPTDIAEEVAVRCTLGGVVNRRG